MPSVVLTFYAFVETVDSDNVLYTVRKADTEDSVKQEYIDHIKNKASVYYDGMKTGDRLLVLSTCASYKTNGRYILIGTINRTPEADTTEPTKNETTASTETTSTETTKTETTGNGGTNSGGGGTTIKKDDSDVNHGPGITKTSTEASAETSGNGSSETSAQTVSSSETTGNTESSASGKSESVSSESQQSKASSESRTSIESPVITTDPLAELRTKTYITDEGEKLTFSQFLDLYQISEDDIASGRVKLMYDNSGNIIGYIRKTADGEIKVSMPKIVKTGQETNMLLMLMFFSMAILFIGTEEKIRISGKREN